MALLLRDLNKAARFQPLLKYMRSPCTQMFEPHMGAPTLIFARGKKRAHTKKKNMGLADPKLPKDKPKKETKKVQTSTVVEDPDVKFEGRVPEDDVWIRKYYPTPRYSVLEAVAMHREAASPEISDNMDGMLVASLTLDMRLKKKTKFFKEFSRTVELPHFFDDGTEHRLLVFCKTDADKTLATSLGAEFAGGLDLVKAMTKGDIKHDDYDHVICTADIYSDLGLLRKHLRDRYPNPLARSVGTDVEAMFKYFTEGKTYECRKPEDKIGILDAHFATLNMSDEQIQENYDKVIEEITLVKSADLGQFITKAVIECPPSGEVFVIKDSELLPKEKRGKKVKKLVQDEEPPPTEEDDDEQAEAVAK